MSKKKIGFTSSMIFIGGSSLINMAIGLLTTPVITRLVVPESFGQLSIFTMYTNLAVMILCLGMDQTLVRFYYESEDIKYKRELLRECVMLPLLMTLIGSIVAWGLAQYELIHFEFEPKMLLILLLNIFAGLLYRFSAMTVRLNYHNRLYAGLNIINKISYVVFALLLLTLTKVNDFTALAIATTSTSVFVLIISLFSEKSFYTLRRKNEIPDIVSYVIVFWGIRLLL